MAIAAPTGFIRSTIQLNARPVGLAFDPAGTLYALEGAAFLSNDAVLRTVLPNGVFGASFPVEGLDPDNFFVGGMTYDPFENRVLITDNTGSGLIYAVDSVGDQTTIASDLTGIAGIVVRDSGEIFVSTAAPGGGQVLLIDRNNGPPTVVLPGLEFGAGLAFDAAGDLIVQDAYDLGGFNLRGRLQKLPITETASGLEFGEAEFLGDGLQSRYALIVDSDGDLLATGGGGLYEVSEPPLEESLLHASQFSASIAFDPGTGTFEPFAGPDGGRLAFAAEAEFDIEDTFITLLTPAEPGDYNGEGSVNDMDYSLWLQTYGSTEDLPADGNLDGIASAADYVVWRKFASEVLATHATTQPAGVPEPALTGMIAALLVLSPARLGLRREFP